MTHDLIGKRFGRLIVLCYYQRAGNEHKWKCQCDCGATCIHRTQYFYRSPMPSCGCYKREKVAGNNFKHGGYRTRLFRIWRNMQQRCYNEKKTYYKNYGGKGIKLCPEWNKDFVAFRDWALTHGYDDTLTIDRIDVNSDYCPANCRWIPLKEQGRNKHNTLFVMYNGGKTRLIELCRQFGVPYATAWKKLKKRGIPIEQIF